MEGKLFVFGIGGTGARVIKALVMLLASGVKLDTKMVVPIILDPHQSNEDLKRTTNILNWYQKIRGELSEGRRDKFFATEIKTLQALVPDETLSGNFAFKLKGVSDETFSDYIAYNSLDKKNKAMASLLFSKLNLSTEMDIGFVGNPNIGSVVLNQFKDSQEFKHFASNFTDKDRIFIISSIFGGTGAAGFPSLVKNIRNAQNIEDTVTKISNKEHLQNAKIGAVTVLPYFGVEPTSDSVIDKETFIGKTKSALSYYERNITNSKILNALYYIGDDNTRDYKNDPGGNGQKNDAHFVELAAALSVINFVSIPDSVLITENGKVQDPIYREYGIKEDTDSIDFTKLGDYDQNLLSIHLTKYFYFNKYINEHLEDVVKAKRPQPFTNRKEPKIEGSLFTSHFFNSWLKPFNKEFTNWLEEMSQNRRAFVPFYLNGAELGECINGIKPKAGFWDSKFDYDLFNGSLNKVELDNTYQTLPDKIIVLFNEAVDKVIRDKFDYFKGKE